MYLLSPKPQLISIIIQHGNPAPKSCPHLGTVKYLQLSVKPRKLQIRK